MKRKKIIKLIIWGIGLVCIIGIANFIITSGTVERNSADYEKAKIKNWNAVMAKSSNKKVINLQVDKKKIEPKVQARRWHAEDLQPLCAKLGEENTGKTLVAVTALEQVGLIAAAEKGGAKVWELVPTAGKKNLADAPILKCLEGM